MKRFVQGTRRVRFLGALGLALLCSACGGGERRPVYPVTGKVLLQGKPVPNALVVLHPVDGSNRAAERPAGEVETDGTFHLTTYGKGDGAPEGDYAVTVTCYRAVRTSNGDYQPGPNILPARYSKPDTSGLRVRVTNGTTELPPLKLGR